MYLVHQNDMDSGKWQVAWMWLPSFLALDRSLHKFVDEGMTRSFKGQSLPSDPEQRDRVLCRMHQEVIRLILSKYKIDGLKDYLTAVSCVTPINELEK